MTASSSAAFASLLDQFFRVQVRLDHQEVTLWVARQHVDGEFVARPRSKLPFSSSTIGR